jgi:ABC-type glycerol-3-phosphate transport system substrate-binding protein
MAMHTELHAVRSRRGFSRRAFVAAAAAGCATLPAALAVACGGAAQAPGAAPGGGTAAPAMGKVTFAYLGDDVVDKIYNDLADEAEKANPGLKVNLRSVGWQQNHDSTAQMIAANQLPDLVNTATIWLPEWVKANAIMPVSSDIVSPALQKSFVPSLFQKGAEYQGKIWGLPIAAAARWFIKESSGTP